MLCGLFSSCGVKAPHYSGLSCCEAQALGQQASVAAARSLNSCGSQALEHRLNSCGEWAQLLYGLWDLPGSGIELMSPVLSGRFFTTEPPGKLVAMLLLYVIIFDFLVGNRSLFFLLVL